MIEYVDKITLYQRKTYMYLNIEIPFSSFYPPEH